MGDTKLNPPRGGEETSRRHRRRLSLKETILLVYPKHWKDTGDCFICPKVTEQDAAELFLLVQ